MVKSEKAVNCFLVTAILQTLSSWSLKAPVILQCIHLRNHSLQIFHLPFFVIILQARWGVCIISVWIQALYLQITILGFFIWGM